MRVTDWDEFTSPKEPGTLSPLALTIGVFDGVHLGHRALISRILAEDSCVPTVVTFRQNPMKTVSPDRRAVDILSLTEKLAILEALGVGLTVLIDFSGEFCKINGRDFIDLLLSRHPVKLIALGEDFRCGHGLDTGVREIGDIARSRGVEVWVAPSVMDGGQAVSSSRIRRALAAGHVAEAERLLGRHLRIDNGRDEKRP